MRSSRQAAVIHVIDGDEGARFSLLEVLRAQGYEVQGHADATALLQAGLSPLPACLVMALPMSTAEGPALVETLRQHLSPVPVIVLIGELSLPLVVAAMKAGAFDVLDRSSAKDALLGAVGAALGELDRAVRGEQEAARRMLSGLTARERAVLGGLVDGKINRTIGQELGISPRTVEVYRAHIMRKARVGSLSELIGLALKAGMEGEQAASL